MSEKHPCSIENAERFLDWIKTRGGIAIWESVSLSNPGASWSTPALTDGKPTTKPNWQCANEPVRIITDINDVEVCVDREVKRFHVATRLGSQGLMIKVTDGGSRKIRKEVEKAGKGAYHVFDYGNYENAVIMAPEKTLSLTEWAQDQVKA